MLTLILIAILATVANVAVQFLVVIGVVRYAQWHIRTTRHRGSLVGATQVLGGAISGLFVGHLLQIALWAGIFRRCEEFPDYRTAFYHSTVNFVTLGYGDIVMSPEWRLLGALEGLNGTLMIGLSTALAFWLLSQLFANGPAETDD